MPTIRVEDLPAKAAPSPDSLSGKVLVLSDRAFLKEHAYSLEGTSLVAPQLRQTLLLDERALMVVEQLDGTKTDFEVAHILRNRLGLPLAQARAGVGRCVAELTRAGLVQQLRQRRPRPVRRVLRTTEFSLEKIEWELTQRCNMACPYCYNDDHQVEMAPASCDKVIDNVISLGITQVAVTGGEPTLHPSFWRIVDELSRAAVALCVSTNGSGLSGPEVARLASSGVIEVSLSIDSLEEADSGRLGQHPMGPRRLLRLIDHLKEAGLRVRTNTILLPGINCTVAKAVRLYDALHELDVDRCAFAEVLPFGRGQHHRPGPGVLDVAVALGERERGNGAAARLERSQRDCGCMPEPGPRVPSTACGVGTRLMGIGADGGIVPCLRMPGLVAGNMNSQALRDIWESAKIWAAFRSRRDSEAAACRRCPDWQACLGGCKARAAVHGRRLAAPDPWSCAFFGHVRRAKRSFASSAGSR